MQGKSKWLWVLGTLLIVIIGSIVAQMFIKEESTTLLADGSAGVTVSKRKFTMPFGDKKK